MNDIYSKAVMTVIAVALTVIAGNQLFGPAQAQFGDGCGDDSSDSCFVTVVNAALVRGTADAIRQECVKLFSGGKWADFNECVNDNIAEVRVWPLPR